MVQCRVALVGHGHAVQGDAASGELWSATWQPRGTRPDSYDVMFAEDRAEIVRRDGTLTTTLDIAVSPEDDAEVRRVSIANAGAQARDIQVAFIAVNRQGQVGAYALQKGFSYSLSTSDTPRLINSEYFLK